VEKYLDKCVQSILNQTFKDFELILIDDGSPDSCGKMCDEWKKKDNRIKVIHKKNGGLSDARNAGIDIAIGDYIGFVDSDDYIKEDMFEVLVNNLEKNNADISICGYVDVYADGFRNESLDRKVYVWNQEEAIKQILLGKLLSVHAWTKLYKRTLFSDVRYPVGKISEDAYVIMNIMEQVKTAVFTPYSAYYYIHREGSINTGAYREVDKTRVEAHEKNYKYISNRFPVLKALAYDRYIGAISFVAHKMAFSCISERKNSDCKKMFAILRKNIFNIYKSEYFSLKRKISITVLVMSKKLYRFLMKKIYRIQD
jgi:glycosyltransferase involved in cell wall biosynthesis